MLLNFAPLTNNDIQEQQTNAVPPLKDIGIFSHRVADNKLLHHFDIIVGNPLLLCCTIRLLANKTNLTTALGASMSICLHSI